jgi:hypothetical protein
LFLPWKILTLLENFQASCIGFAVVPYPVPASRRPMQTSIATAGRFGRRRLHANTRDFFLRTKCYIGLDQATTNTGLFLPWKILTRLEKFQASCIGFAVVPYPVPASRRPMQTSTATAAASAGAACTQTHWIFLKNKMLHWAGPRINEHWIVLALENSDTIGKIPGILHWFCGGPLSCSCQ